MNRCFLGAMITAQLNKTPHLRKTVALRSGESFAKIHAKCSNYSQGIALHVC